jgi:cyclopropane fatty-acyl-phospholipid synthase-like methyltransferase
MAKVFSSIVKDQIMNHHPEMLIFQGGLITSYLKIILVVLMNIQVEASQESFQHDIHTLQPSAYNFEARQTTAQPSIFADIDEVYVHLEYASFFG